MHSLNIMWLLNKVDRNTEIDIRCVKTKSADWIEISTKDLEYYIDEYGSWVIPTQRRKLFINIRSLKNSILKIWLTNGRIKSIQEYMKL